MFTPVISTDEKVQDGETKDKNLRSASLALVHRPCHQFFDRSLYDIDQRSIAPRDHQMSCNDTVSSVHPNAKYLQSWIELALPFLRV